MVNIVGQTNIKEINTKTLGIILWAHVLSNPHYITSEAYVVGYDIFMDGKLCVFERLSTK